MECLQFISSYSYLHLPIFDARGNSILVGAIFVSFWWSHYVGLFASLKPHIECFLMTCVYLVILWIPIFFLELPSYLVLCVSQNEFSVKICQPFGTSDEDFFKKYYYNYSVFSWIFLGVSPFYVVLCTP